MEQNITPPDSLILDSVMDEPVSFEKAIPRKLTRKRVFSAVPAAEKTAVMVNWLEANKGRHVVAIDVRGQSPCMDAVVVVTATSMRHARSLADGIAELCTKEQYEFFRLEGYQTGQWILVDCNDVLVNIFQPETRELFNLEGLWKNAAVLHEGAGSTD